MSTSTIRRLAIGACTGVAAVGLLAGAAGAHTTVFPTEAPSGGYAKLDFRVPHGCDGEPTEALRVKIPEGVTSVKPQVVAGWEIEVKEEELDEPIETEGEEPITTRVTEVVWSGDSLEDGHLQEFGLSVKLPEGDPGEVVYFPAIQECPGDAEAAWIEIPSDSDEGEELESPAPGVALTEAEGGHGGGGGEEEGTTEELDAEPAAATDDGTDPLTVVALVVAVLGLAAGVGGLMAARKRA